MGEVEPFATGEVLHELEVEIGEFVVVELPLALEREPLLVLRGNRPYSPLVGGAGGGPLLLLPKPAIGKYGVVSRSIVV